MAKCAVTSKVFLTVLTVIFWAAAAGLIFLGAWVYKEYQHYEEIGEAVYTLVPATILMAVGVFMFILGLVGCVGAFKEQKCMLGVYFSILLIIFVGVVAAGALGYVYRRDVDSAIWDGMEKALTKYGTSNNTVWTDEVDFMQEKLECCGSENYTTWKDTPYGKAHPKAYYPPSCCRDQNCTYNLSNDTMLYEKGCYNYVKDEFLSHLAWVAGVAGAFAIIQLVGMICSCVLICKRQTQPPYIGLTSPDHMRV